MSSIDHEAETVCARPSRAQTVASGTAAPGSGCSRVVRDTQPLDTATERYPIQRLLGEGGYSAGSSAPTGSPISTRSNPSVAGPV
jgi:hypothetical protein